MPLQVKILPEREDWVSCPRCLAELVDVYVFHVFVGDGSDKTDPMCAKCFLGGEQLFIIEQPDLSPGRHPPSRRLVKRTQKEERELAKRAGGRRQPASGALPGLKGDGVLKGVARWDSKMCFSKTVSWNFDDLVKIRSEAAYGEIPAIITAFTDRATHQVRERWVTIPYEIWEEKIIHASHHHQ